jgi:putative cardiolipin synthase
MPRLRHPLAVLLLAVAGACASLGPPDVARTPSHALEDARGTPVETALRAQLRVHPEMTGLRLLPTGTDGFLARAALADLAQKTLDVQYYIVHGDASGGLLLERIVAAADRGVRVRLLFDDLQVTGWDDALAVLDAHPRIEVRVFNPFRARGRFNPLRLMEAVFDFGRVNRRMHNKVFAADNIAAIVGGRNLGDEYFEAREDLDFHDLDVLAIGPAVRDISASFDAYWNSEWAVPMAALVDIPPEQNATARLRQHIGEHRERVRESSYSRNLESSAFARDLEAGDLALHWARAIVVADDPAKIGSSRPRPDQLLLPALADLPTRARREMLIVSAYFVPGEAGVRLLADKRAEGVKVKVLTNSLASIDVPLVYAAYSKYREPLVRQGIELFEYKATAGPAPRERSSLGSGSRGSRGSGSIAASRSSLHAKAIVVDRRIVFIGSLNLDPRSVLLNTEVGLRIENEALAEEVVRLFDATIRPEAAYRIEIHSARSGIEEVIWATRENGREVRFDASPETTWWQRTKTGLMGALAPDALL